GHAGGVEVVAQRGPDAADLVGDHLLALTRAAEHDAALDLARGDGAGDGGADGRVVDGGLAVGALVDHLVAEVAQGLREVFLQVVAGVIGTDGDAHVISVCDRWDRSRAVRGDGPHRGARERAQRTLRCGAARPPAARPAGRAAARARPPSPRTPPGAAPRGRRCRRSGRPPPGPRGAARPPAGAATTAPTRRGTGGPPRRPVARSP